VRTRYLALVEVYGTKEEKRQTIAETRTWLENHLEDSSVRTKYIVLVEEYGTEEERRQVIAETRTWLENHLEDTSVRTRYLALVEVYGTKEEKRQTIAETRSWLKNHLEDSSVRTKYISFCGKVDKKKTFDIDIEVILMEQWQWIKDQPKITSDIWGTFLQQVFYFLTEKSDLVQNAVKYALDQHPGNLIIFSNIFGYFHDYLEKKLCYRLVEKIISLKYPHSKLLQNWVYAANFFRDEGEYDKAKSVYESLFRFCQNNVGEVYRKTYNFSSLSYAQLMLLQGYPDEALPYLELPLREDPKNPQAYLIKAQYFKEKGQYNKATDCFEKAVKFVGYNKEYFWHEYGCFVRNYLKDDDKARECLKASIQQKENLPAYVELAEIELESDNKEKAKVFLEKGLNLKLKNRKERDESKKLESRIIHIKQAVDYDSLVKKQFKEIK
jgi:tetratricopeptide (TPR) repeat protein